MKTFALVGVGIALVCAITFFILKSKKYILSENETDRIKSFLKKYENDFYYKYPIKYTNLKDSIVQYIQSKEGGLSKLESDSASKNPVGVEHTYKGVTSDRWHTNKGITWEAYKNLGDKLNYTPTAKEFYSMPFERWFQIYSHGYLKPVSRFNSDLVNYYLSLWSWGSGVGGANSLINAFEKDKEDINSLVKKYGEKNTVLMLCEYRIKFFERLADQKIESVKNSNKSETEKQKLIKQLQSTRKSWINGVLNFVHFFLNN